MCCLWMECCQALLAKRAEMRRGGAWCVFVMKHIWRYIQPKGHCFWWRGKIFSTKWETFHLNQLGEFLEVSFADSRSCCWGSCWGTIADGHPSLPWGVEPPTQALPSRALQSHGGSWQGSKVSRKVTQPVYVDGRHGTVIWPTQSTWPA